jgi:hypothetical protein
MVVKFLHPTSEFCQTCTQAFEPHLAPLEGFPIFKSIGASIPRSDISQSHSGRLERACGSQAILSLPPMA